MEAPYILIVGPEPEKARMTQILAYAEENGVEVVYQPQVEDKEPGIYKVNFSKNPPFPD